MKIEYLSPEIEFLSLGVLLTGADNSPTSPGGAEDETPFLPFSF